MNERTLLNNVMFFFWEEWERNCEGGAKGEEGKGKFEYYEMSLQEYEVYEMERGSLNIMRCVQEYNEMKRGSLNITRCLYKNIMRWRGEAWRGRGNMESYATR